MITYDELLKTEKEKAQEEQELKSQQLNEQLEQAHRNSWLNKDDTKKYLLQIDQCILQLNEILLVNSHNPQLSDQHFRLCGVEVQTLKKVQNLLNYGRYDINISAKQQ